MKGQFSQGNPCFRHARILGKIADELLQRRLRFFVAFRGLHQTFLQSQIGTNLFVASLLLQLGVVNQETGVVAKLQPAAGGIEERSFCPGRIGMRDLFESRGRGIKPLRQIVRLRGQKIDASQQRRLRMQQTCVIQDRNCLIEMAVLDFKLCKLKKGTCDHGGFDGSVPQVGK